MTLQCGYKERRHRAVFARWRLSRLIVSLLFHPAEVGTHLIGQAGQTVQQLGIIPEHFVVLCFLVDDVVIHFAPAFLEQSSALDFHIVAFVLDGVVQGAVDTGGNDINLAAGIDLGIAGAFIGLGALRNIVVIGVTVKIVESVINVLIGIIFKPACDVAMEVDPIFPIQEEYPDADKIRYKLIEIGVCLFLLEAHMRLPNQYLQKYYW